MEKKTEKFLHNVVCTTFPGNFVIILKHLPYTSVQILG